MRLSIESNFPQVQAAIDRLGKDLGSRVSARAVNRTTDIAKTAMSREIRSEFNLNASKVREKLFSRKATFRGGSLGVYAELYSRDKSGRRRAINVINFSARETKQGLTAKIRRAGGRVVVSKSAFIGNKRRTAFKRTTDKRLPIAPVQTIDVPQMFNTKRINAKVVRLILHKFPEVFEREARFEIARFNK